MIVTQLVLVLYVAGAVGLVERESKSQFAVSVHTSLKSSILDNIGGNEVKQASSSNSQKKRRPHAVRSKRFSDFFHCR